MKLLDLADSTDYVSFYGIEPKFTEWILQKWHESIKQIDFHFLLEFVKNPKVRTRKN